MTEPATLYSTGILISFAFLVVYIFIGIALLAWVQHGNPRRLDPRAYTLFVTAWPAMLAIIAISYSVVNELDNQQAELDDFE